MRHDALAFFALLVATTGCAATTTEFRPAVDYLASSRGTAVLCEGPTIPPPENDIPESQRTAWIEANRPAPPPQVERVVVHETAPVHYVREYERCNDWVAPVSFVLGLGLGYWWGDDHHGHHHGHHGYHWR
jgi:hypothetical protein